MTTINNNKIIATFCDTATNKATLTKSAGKIPWKCYFPEQSPSTSFPSHTLGKARYHFFLTLAFLTISIIVVREVTIIYVQMSSFPEWYQRFCFIWPFKLSTLYPN